MKKYKIIYADPPWKYNDKALNRGGAERHYSTMNLEDIKNLPVNNLADKDSLLFMWATFPLLPEALEVMKAWGFKYKTNGFTWVKRNKNVDSLYMGMGGYTRSNAEICLIGKKGKGVERLDASIRQTQIHPIMKHSKKPSAFRDDIVKMYGVKCNKIELFSRDSLFFWDVHGNETNGVNLNDYV